MTGRSSSRVIFDFYDWEITLRELIFSVLILGVMVFIGFLVSSAIEEKVNSRNLTYRQASTISTTNEFQHALRTDAGHAFVNGRFTALKPVRNSLIDGEYLGIRVAHQEYRMHTQHYTTTDSKGRVHHHTRHYWTWDTMHTEEHHSPDVEYCGVKFPYDKFNYHMIYEDTHTEKTGHNRRDVINTMPREFNATIFANIVNRGISGSADLSTMGIEAYRKYLVEDHSLVLFWLLWGILIGFALYGFYYCENRWLEDN